MKRSSRILLCFVLAFALSASFFSCGKQAQEHEGYVLAEIPGGDYDYYYPEDWTADRLEAGLVSVHAGDTDFSNVNITVLTYQDSAGLYSSLEDYVKKNFIKKLESCFSSLNVAKNEDGTERVTPVEVDGAEAIRFEYTAEVFDGQNAEGKDQTVSYSFRTYLIPNGINVYFLTYTATADRYESHLTEVEKMVDYLRFH